VALASYAAAGISGSNPMETSVASFKIGIAAFVVPFMFFYNSALLMDGTTVEIIRVFITAGIGIYLLAAGAQGWFLGDKVKALLRVMLLAAALFLVEGGFVSDIIGASLTAGVFLLRKFFGSQAGIIPSRGMD
jgi:TRAP-type uncharacterized transport system fused permease subunit